jgi:hypothetical protein
MGRVMSLNKHGERLAVQAAALDGSMLEEVNCETDGTYRIRGLKPGEYKVIF